MGAEAVDLIRLHYDLLPDRSPVGLGVLLVFLV